MNFNKNGELLLADLSKTELRELESFKPSKLDSLKQEMVLSLAKFFLKLAIKLVKKANQPDEINLPVGIKIEKIELTQLPK